MNREAHTTLQRAVSESPCIYLGHKWLATTWAERRAAIETPADVLAWECLRCGARAERTERT